MSAEFWLECVLGPEDQRAHLARRAASAIDHTEVVLWHLTRSRSTHDLASRFDDVTEPPGQSRLPARQLTTIGVYREAAFVGSVGRRVERADLPLLTEASVLNRRRNEDRVA